MKPGDLISFDPPFGLSCVPNLWSRPIDVVEPPGYEENVITYGMLAIVIRTRLLENVPGSVTTSDTELLVLLHGTLGYTLSDMWVKT